MPTTETRTADPAGDASGGLVYDGFISYSHAADDLLAPRLQAGLQRFAKAWWKRRALRIFRDEASLSANPHLWSSITDALDQSAWFVLLLSPEAADSEWVNREVEYWLEHKHADQIIPVVTDGEFSWSETDIKLESTAAPPALYGAFSDEPRWVDLRFARSEEQLDLNNPRFSAAVADIASAIRGVPKDELESEEVRQHRRTVRTAWAAAAALLILALVAGAAAIYALDQRNATAQQRDIAEANAAAAGAAAEAEAQARQEAEQQRAEAETQAAIAQAREVVLESEKTLEFDPELSTYLALAALESFRQAGEDPGPAVSALRAAIANDRIMVRVPGGTFVAVHPDGSLMATKDGDGVAIWDITGEEVVERYARPDNIDRGLGATGAAFSPDGNLLAVSFEDAVPPVTIWDRTTGESFTIGTYAADFVETFRFSPDGELLAFNTDRLEVWSLTEQRVVYEDEFGGGSDFNADGLLSYGIRAPDETGEMGVRVVDPLSGGLIQILRTDFAPFGVEWSPDGTQIAAADQATVTVIEVASGAEIARTTGRVFRPEWLPAADRFVVGGELLPRVIDAATGEIVMELPGQAGGTWSYDIVPGTTLLASASLFADDTVIFDTSLLGGFELGGWLAPDVAQIWSGDYAGDGERVVLSDFYSYLTADALDGRESRFVQGNPTETRPEIVTLEVSGNAMFVASADLDGNWIVRATDTDEVIYRAPQGWLIRGVSLDGTRAVIEDLAAVASQDLAECDPRVVSTIDDSFAVDLATAHCASRAFFSPNGELVVGADDFASAVAMGVFDTDSGQLLARLPAPYVGWEVAFTPDSSKLVFGSAGGPVYVFDVATLVSGVAVEQALLREIPAHDAFVVRISVSPDGSMAATTSWNEPLKVWNLDTGQLLGQFGGDLEGLVFHDGDFHPSLPQLLVTSPPNEVRIHTLDVDELIAIAKTRLSRDMTEEECQQYFRRSCGGS